MTVISLIDSYLYTNIEIGVIGAKTDLTYDYEYLGSSAKAIDDLIAGKGDFAKVFFHVMEMSRNWLVLRNH